MNAHSPMWNPHCRQKQNAGPLEELIETYKLLVNNDTGFPTRPGSQGLSIIDLALTSPDLGLLRVWEIPKEYPSLSDHELIVLEWDGKSRKPATSNERMEHSEPTARQKAMASC